MRRTTRISPADPAVAPISAATAGAMPISDAAGHR